jgi:16S rRNA (adenine1518-N6/adenine1519-N6)-dimethyltransferase
MKELVAPPPLREIIRTFQLDARKKLGQHFLLDENLTAKIARQAGDLDGRNVIEVGPGPGGLTRALLETRAAHVTAVEIDRRAAEAIRDLATHHPGRLTLLEADALATDLSALVRAPRQIVANLPYNLATPLLISWLRQAACWERMTLMFQLEVAERITAAPDTPAYGRLSVLAQWICDTSLLMRIPPAAFTPPPKVFSAVVGFAPRPHQPDAALFAAMERLTASAFQQRRKMLRGALRGLGGEALLARARIDPVRRAETLSVSEFEVLASLLLREGPAVSALPT